MMSVTNVGAVVPAVPQVVYFHQALLFSRDEAVPHTAYQKVRTSIFRMLAVRSMKKSAFVITQTHAMREVILRDAGLAPERVVVVYPGVPVGAPRSVWDSRDWRRCLEELASCRLPKIVYVSGPSEHKNFEVLLRATASLKRRGMEVLTVLTLARDGTPNARYGRFVRRFGQLVDELGIGGNIFWTGVLPNEAIIPLIRSIDVCVFPSLIESFPQPLAEALSCGAVMVLADRPYAREIAGEAAVYFDPYQAEDLANKVCALLSDGSLRATLRERAFLRARAFSYENCARQIWGILQQASVTGRRY
jgi:glycosyltransferase involved in cell wall biosynthesis